MNKMIKINKNNPSINRNMAINTVSFIAFFFALVSFATISHAVQKCQDADGKWHYGDIAVAACENSKITTLDERGFIEDELAPPKTEEELASEARAATQAEEEAERMRLEEENKLRILSIYETEADIDRHRDNQLDSVNGNIAVHKAFLKSQEARIKRNQAKIEITKHLAAKKRLTQDIEDVKGRMQTYQSALEKLLDQKEQIVKKFDSEKALYQRLKIENSKSAKKS